MCLNFTILCDLDIDLLNVYGHDHSSHGIEGQRSRLELRSQFESQSVEPQFYIEDSFLVFYILHAVGLDKDKDICYTCIVIAVVSVTIIIPVHLNVVITASFRV